MVKCGYYVSEVRGQIKVYGLKVAIMYQRSVTRSKVRCAELKRVRGHDQR